jgi:GxxExxY protein
MSLSENEVGQIVVDRALQVHRELGPGLLESTYEACLCHELREAGLYVEAQKALPVVYRGVHLDCGYRMDLLIEKKVIVEIKAVEALNDVHLAQILTYLKLSGCKLGYLVNFNVKRIKEGIRRVVNQLSEETQN